MFTLQILDRGQTFLHAIEDRPLLLGNGTGADVVLHEDGVQEAHARIEPGNGSVRLVALAPTLVNGARVERVELQLGDRIELGRAVLIVGRTVARAAKPEDVLADVLPQQPRRPVARARSRLVPFLAVVAAGGALVAWLAQSSGGPSVSDQFAAIRRARETGQLEQAAADIDRLQHEWVDTTDSRLRRLAAERDAVRAVQAVVSRLSDAIHDPADKRTRAEWEYELRRLEVEGEENEQIAARIVQATLPQAIGKRPQPAPQRSDAPEPTRSPEPTASSEPAGPAATAPVAVTPTPATSSPGSLGAGTRVAPVAAPRAGTAPVPDLSLAEVTRLCEQGHFAQAIALLDTKLAAADAEGVVAQLNERLAAVRDQSKQAMAKVVAEAGMLMRTGKAANASRVLQAAVARFPATGEFTAIADQLAKAEAAAAAAAGPPTEDGQPPVDAAARAATLADVRAQMDAVRAAEEKGAFADAAQRLRAAAAGLRDRDPGYADRLVARADEADLLAAWNDAVAAAMKEGRKVATTSRSGAPVELTRVDAGVLVAAGGGDTRMTWYDVAPAGIRAIAEQLAIGGRPALGAAALAYKQGDRDTAEAMLAAVLRADAAMKEPVDRAIARGRGEPFDPRGYSFGKEGFVSVRSLELQKETQKFAVKLDAALRDKNPAARDALVAEAKAAGTDSAQALVFALQKELGKQVQKLDGSPLRKQLDRLDKQRVALDGARKNAKDLIYDEVKYFYPYRPPAVSSDRFAEYSRVQAEVDNRVEALRDLWNDDRARVRVPANLRSDLDRVDWIAAELSASGGFDAGALSGIEWARALPAGDSIGVRDYCRTLDERTELDEWRRIEAYNLAMGKEITAAQRDLLKITNEYRLMFRHRPLAIVKELCAASQGHADEMARLGYFAHESPTEGRRWPHDRMKLAGYDFGSSENIALCDGAQGSHVAWCHSSGHHRNLLQPNHREIGIGADGRYWVQNFGSGNVHREHPAWLGVLSKKR